LLNPRSVAVFGVSEKEDSVAGTMFANMRKSGFTGPVFPVNPKYDVMLGEKCYAYASELPETPDLAMIATPRPTVAQIMEDCGARGVRHAIVLSAGFREVGAKGVPWRKPFPWRGEEARHPLHRPQLPGYPAALHRPQRHLQPGAPLPATWRWCPQSGALCTSMLDWAEANGIGFSSVISTGASADLDFGEILDYLAYDPPPRASCSTSRASATRAAS
jgi:acetyltransferase